MGRLLDTTESIFHACNRLDALMIVQVLHLEGMLEESTVRTALLRLQRRHLPLRWRIEDEPAPRFVDTDALPELRVASATGEHDWQAFANAELNAGYPRGARLPWRVTWVRGPAERSSLLLHFPHCLVDGVALRCLSVELLAHLNDPRTREGYLEPLDPQASIPVPVDSRLGVPGVLARLERRARRVVQRLRPPPAVRLPYAGTARWQDRRSAVAVARLPIETVQRIRQRARDEKTTVNGVLSSAALGTLRQVFGLEEQIPIVTSVDLRALCATPAPADQIGCFVASVTTRHQSSADTSPWPLAREVTQAVREEIDRAEWIPALIASQSRLGEVWSGIQANANDPVSQGRSAPLGMSNRGIYATPPGAVKLVAVDAFSSSHTVGNGLSLLVNSTEQTLSLALTYVLPLTTVESAERFVRTLAETLGRLGA